MAAIIQLRVRHTCSFKSISNTKCNLQSARKWLRRCTQHWDIAVYFYTAVEVHLSHCNGRLASRSARTHGHGTLSRHRENWTVWEFRRQSVPPVHCHGCSITTAFLMAFTTHLLYMTEHRVHTIEIANGGYFNLLVTVTDHGALWLLAYLHLRVTLT